MVLIVAHHYVVNSGLTTQGGPLLEDSSSGNSIFLTLFGAWGKTGINCFLMITGYFMCTSTITFRKLLKLMGQIYFYKCLIYPVLFVGGYETISFQRIVKLLMPFWGFSDGFTSCFIAFWLTIPFLSFLVQNMSKRQHQLLLLLVLGIYTILGSIPSFVVRFNYITWFGIIFLIASYIRLHPHPLFNRRKIWGWLTLTSILFAIASILVLRILFDSRAGLGYDFVSDSNKLFAVAIAVSSFLWFKNMKIKHSKVINSMGAATFGVFLIHANSEAMRTWLWKNTVDVLGHYSTMTTGGLALYSIGVVLLVFIICNLIDQLRVATIEKWFFNWYDCKLSARADALVKKIIHN